MNPLKAISKQFKKDKKSVKKLLKKGKKAVQGAFDSAKGFGKD